jgi:DNA repair protein RecO (recombination protein O)
MAIVKTPAVILKCDNYRETSKIVTFYTPEHGKLRGIAKGVRNSKSKWGGALQSMAYVNMIFYLKENRTLHLISGAEYAAKIQNVSDDYDKMRIGFRIIELINQTTPEHHENRDLFSLIVESLEMLNDATKNYVNVLFNFEFRLLKILGFEVNPKMYSEGSVEKSKGNRYVYDTRIDAGDRKIMNAISSGNFNSLMSLNISKSQETVLERFFENYVRDHFEHAGYLKSKRVFESKEMIL